MPLSARWAGTFLVLATSGVRGQSDVRAGLESEFTRTVRPFLEMYCISCHGHHKDADRDLPKRL